MPTDQQYTRPPDCCNHCHFVMHYEGNDYYLCTMANEVLSSDAQRTGTDRRCSDLIQAPGQYDVGSLTRFELALIERALAIDPTAEKLRQNAEQL